MGQINWILATICLCSVVNNGYGYLNLFLNSTETRRLLGIEGDLFYVRNGTVNDYALSFNLLIRPEHSNIYFSWQNLRQNHRYPMFYSLSVEMEERFADVMDPPLPSIEPEGEVPTRLSVFSVHLGCRGSHSAEVNIKLTLNVAIFSPANITTLEIRRRKSCLHYTGKIDRGPWFEHADPAYNMTQDEISRKMNAPTNIFYIGLGCACGLILLVALVIVIYYVRSQKATNVERLSETSSSKGLTTQTTQSFLRPETPNNSIVSLPVLKRGFSLSELKPNEVNNLLQEIHIERSRITIGEVLMEGTFGRIFLASLSVCEDDIEEEHDILIKTVTDMPVARKDQIDVMLREGCMLKSFANPNLLPIVASCMENPMQPFLIYNYNNESNLKKFLLRCQVSDMGPHQSLSTQQFVYIAIQISRALLYLHRRRIVHRDVSCRNCVVDSQWVVKVTDNALSRDFFPNDYHCLGDNENRPIKWMSVEALQEKKFSPASDVWAFGVLLWELMMMGQQPYADIDPFEMATYLKEGYRIAQPHNCPDELFAVMACCWAMAPEERPKINQLQLCLHDFYQALGRFV